VGSKDKCIFGVVGIVGLVRIKNFLEMYRFRVFFPTDNKVKTSFRLLETHDTVTTYELDGSSNFQCIHPKHC
jgi:hypothetical protein